METGMKRDKLLLEQLLGTGADRAGVAGDVMLPGGLREEAHVLAAHATAVVERAEALQDRVSVAGRVVFHVLYTKGDPGKVSSIEAAADFTHLCELRGCQPRARVTAAAMVEQVDASVTGSRLTMQAEVALMARAISQTPVEVITGAEEDDRIRQRKRKVTSRRQVSSGAADALIREEFSLPESLGITETLFASAVPLGLEITGGQGRLGLAGSLALEAVHASTLPGKPLVVTRHSIPFEHAVDMTGENADLSGARINVRDTAAASQVMPDGERLLRAEVLLGLEGWADREETAEILEDAYTTTGDGLRLSRSSMRLRTGETRQQCGESGKGLLMLPEGTRPVRSVLAVFALPAVEAWSPAGSRTMAEGSLRTTLVYLSDDADTPVSVTGSVPFRVSFPVSVSHDDLMTLQVSEADAAPITSDRVEVRWLMHLTTAGAVAEETTFVTDAKEAPLPEAPEEIVLYYARPGETLWEIARRYRTTEESVQRLNPDLPDEAAGGEGVIVWRR